MSVSPTVLAEVKEWIKNSITDDYLLRMQMTFEEQKAKGLLFPIEGLEVDFAEGMGVYKYALSRDQYSDNVLKRDIKSAIDKSISAATYEIYKTRAESQTRQIGIVRLYAGLAAAQCGFIGLSEEEYDELCEPSKSPQFSKGEKSALTDIWIGRPERLGDIPFNTFRELATDVCKQRLLELQEEAARVQATKAAQPLGATLGTTPSVKPVLTPAVLPEAAPLAATAQSGGEVDDSELDGFIVGLAARVNRKAIDPQATPNDGVQTDDVPTPAEVRSARRRRVRHVPDIVPDIEPEEISQTTNPKKRPPMKKLMDEIRGYDVFLNDMQSSVAEIKKLRDLKGRQTAIESASALLEEVGSFRKKLHKEMMEQLGVPEKKRTR